LNLEHAAPPARTRGDRFLKRAAETFAALGARTETAAILLGCLFVTLTLAVLLVLPGKTFTYIYSHDMMIFLDGADRVLSGQVPNRDFGTPLGLLTYLMPALGLWLGGSFGAMMPHAMAAFALMILPMLVYACASRLRLEYALILALFTITLVLTPANVGEQFPSFGMFYNRWGYALLAIVFVLTLPPLRGERRPFADGAVAALILILSFYLKISYFGIAAGFVLLLLFPRATRATAIAAFVGAAAGIAAVELLWGGTASYLSDIGRAAEASGVVRGTLPGLAGVAVYNVGMVAPFALLLGFAWWRGVSLWTLFLCLFMAGAGMLLANQNAQGAGLLTLIPAGIVASHSIARGQPEEAGSSVPLLAFVLVASIAATSILFSTEGLLRHTMMAMRDPTAAPRYAAEVDGFIAQEVDKPAPGMPGLETLRGAYAAERFDLAMVTQIRGLPVGQIIAQPEYLWSVQDGAQLVRSQARLAGKILALDMANPFNALLGRPAPLGIDSWHHAGRTFSDTTHPLAERLFGDVDVVLVPKAPVDPGSALLFRRLYAAYLDQRFERVATSDYWHAYARRTPRL